MNIYLLTYVLYVKESIADVFIYKYIYIIYIYTLYIDSRPQNKLLSFFYQRLCQGSVCGGGPQGAGEQVHDVLAGYSL